MLKTIVVTSVVATAVAAAGAMLLHEVRDEVLLRDTESLLDEISRDTGDYDYGTMMQNRRLCKEARDRVNRIACMRKHTSRQQKRAEKALKQLYVYAPYSTC